MDLENLLQKDNKLFLLNARFDRAPDGYWGAAGPSSNSLGTIISVAVLLIMFFIAYFMWSSLNFYRGIRRLNKCNSYKEIISRNGFRIESAESFGGSDISVKLRHLHSLEEEKFYIPYPEDKNFAIEFEICLQKLDVHLRNRYLD